MPPALPPSDAVPPAVSIAPEPATEGLPPARPPKPESSQPQEEEDFVIVK